MIRRTVSYFGDHSLKVIANAINNAIIPSELLIQQILDIPFYYKINNLEIVAELLLPIIKKIRTSPKKSRLIHNASI